MRNTRKGPETILSSAAGPIGERDLVNAGGRRSPGTPARRGRRSGTTTRPRRRGRLLRREPPPLFQVPRFELLDTDGRPYGPAGALSRARARCDAAGQHQSADPTYDTPERLRAAQAGYGVDPSRWRLLTGAPEAIRSLAVQGFRVPHGDVETRDDGSFDIAHTGKLMLVDGQGALRGSYDSTAEGFDEVFWRSRHVLQEAQAQRVAAPAAAP